MEAELNDADAGGAGVALDQSATLGVADDLAGTASSNEFAGVFCRPLAPTL